MFKCYFVQLKLRLDCRKLCTPWCFYSSHYSGSSPATEKLNAMLVHQGFIKKINKCFLSVTKSITSGPHMFCYRRIMITWRLCFYCFWVCLLQSPRGPSFITAKRMKNAPISNIWKWFANGLLVPCNLGVCINYSIHRTELPACLRALGLGFWFKSGDAIP